MKAAPSPSKDRRQTQKNPASPVEARAHFWAEVVENGSKWGIVAPKT
jgi:hypothetical protein